MYPPAGGDDYSHNYMSGCYGQVTAYPPQCLSFTSYPTFEQDESVLDLRVHSEEFISEEGSADASGNPLALPAPPNSSTASNYGLTQPIQPIPIRPQNQPLMPYGSVPLYQTSDPANPQNNYLQPPNAANNPPPFYNPMQPIPVLNYPPPNIVPPMYPQYYPNTPQYPCVQHPFGPYFPPPPPTTGTRPYAPTSNNPPTSGSRTYSTATNTSSYSSSVQENRDSRQIHTAANVDASSSSTYSSSLNISPLPSSQSSPGQFTPPYNPTVPAPSLQQPRSQPPKNNSKSYYPPGMNNSSSRPSRPSSAGNSNSYNNNAGGLHMSQWYNAKQLPRYNNPQANMLPPRHQYDGKSSGRCQNRGGYNMGSNNSRFRRYGNRQQFSPPSPVLEEPITIITPTSILVPTNDKKKKEHTIKQILENVSSSGDKITANAGLAATASASTPSDVVKSPDDTSVNPQTSRTESTTDTPLEVINMTKTSTNTASNVDSNIPNPTTIDNTLAGSNVDSAPPTTVPTVSIASSVPAPENNTASAQRHNWQNSRGKKKRFHQKNYND